MKKNEMTSYVMILTSKYPKYDGTKGFVDIFFNLFGFLDEQIYCVNEKGEVSTHKVQIPSVCPPTILQLPNL